MPGSRQTFALSVLTALLTGALSAQPLLVTIDATRTGQPITKLMLGGFMEPATTQGWAGQQGSGSCQPQCERWRH